MPTFIPFSPPPGVVTDNTTFDDQGRVYDMSGLRWREGRLETLGGYTLQTNIGVAITNAFGWSQTGTFMTAYGTGTGLFTATGTGSTTQRRPAVLAGINQWSLASWGSYLLAAPSGQTYQLMVWTGVGNAAYIATAPASCTAMVVTPQRQVLMGGTNEEVGGAFNGRCLRWSDLEDYTDWTTATDNNAGEQILDDASDIKALVVLGDGIAILTGSSLWYATFIGQAGQTFKFDKIAATIGPSHRNIACEMQGTLYWFGTDLKMRQWAPGGPINEMACPITRDMRTYYYASTVDRVHLSPLYREEEVWLFYPDTRQSGFLTSATNYIAYCRKESELAQAPVWIKGGLARSAMFDAGDNGVIMASGTGGVYLHELANTLFPDAWNFRTGDFYLSASKLRMYIQEFVPDFEVQTGTVTLVVSTKARPNDSAIGGPTVTILTSDTKKDFRVSGMIANVLVNGTANSSFRMGAPYFVIPDNPGGER